MPTSHYQRTRMRALQARLATIKAESGCSVCGFSDPRALVFHHRVPSDKRFALSSSAYARPPADIDAEIAKCDVLCCNCHAIHHSDYPVPSTVRDHIREPEPEPIVKAVLAHTTDRIIKRRERENGRAIRPVPKP